jgi:hypothetical protein
MSDGESSIIPVVSVSGERGKTGDTGQAGQDGHDGRPGRTGRDGQTGRDGLAGLIGETGIQGKIGLRGKPFSRLQAAVTFGLIAFGLALSVWISDRQTDSIELQQIAIAANSEQIRDAAYAGCVSGLATVRNFNAQQDALADIERSLLAEPDLTPVGERVASKRIKAYEAGKIPIPVDYVCVR